MCHFVHVLYYDKYTYWDKSLDLKVLIMEAKILYSPVSSDTGEGGGLLLATIVSLNMAWTDFCYNKGFDPKT